MLSQTQVIAGVQVQHTTANNYVAIDLNPSIAKRNLQATHPLQVPSAQQRHSQHCPSPNSGVLFYHAAPWTGLYELELGEWPGPALSSEAVAGKSPSGWRMTRQTMTSTVINSILCLYMKTIQLSLWQRHQQWYHKETQGGKVKVSSKLFKLTSCDLVPPKIYKNCLNMSFLTKNYSLLSWSLLSSVEARRHIFQT